MPGTPRTPRDPAARGRRSRVTLATIADEVGVSAMTVSNAYNQPAKVSPELRDRIMATAAALGYAGPHPVARSLRLGRVGSLGVLLGSPLAYAFHDPGVIAFLRGLAEASSGAGVALTLVPVTGDERDAAQRVFDAQVDGFVVYALPDGHALVGAVHERRLPLVVLGGPQLPGTPLVAIDEEAAARAIGAHVAALGHMRIGVVSFPYAWEDRSGLVPTDASEPARRVTRGRLRGFADAARVTGAELVVYEVADNTRAFGATAAAALMELDRAPTALLCMSDELALGALRELHDRGLAVPGDVSVTGWDDMDAARTADPPLTTIAQDLSAQGALCARLLLDGVLPDAPQVTAMPWELVVRASAGPAAWRPGP